MAVDPGKETRIFPLLDRQVVVRQLNEAQLALLAREAGRLSRGALEGKDAMIAVARIMDIMEQTVVQQEDRDFLTDQMIAGKLELRDLMGALTVFGEEAPTTGPVRRGRTTSKR